MNVAKINAILEQAPQKIYEYAQKENTSYSQMILTHEQYKRKRAELYLKLKAEGGKTEKEREYSLDIHPELINIKSDELSNEIDYKAWKIKKERADDTFQGCMEQGRNLRKELGSLDPTVK